MEMILFTGGQAAGKSTFFDFRFRNTHIRINLDMLRTRHRENGLIDACLAFKQPLVIDNTNPTVADRARYIDKARSAGFSITCFFFDVPIEAMLARNDLREGKARVPDAAIRATCRKLERPGLAEGFRAVYRVVPQGSMEFQIEEMPHEI